MTRIVIGVIRVLISKLESLMIIGIDASRAFLDKRTGIEEYSYQVIRHLLDELRDYEVVLYIRKNQKSKIKNQNESADIKDGEIVIPANWRVRVVKMPRLWTQVGLAWEMLIHPVDALFVPAHTVPWIHPKNTVVTIHGLEYEFCPNAYSFWERLYMRLSIKMSCKWANKIISVSQNTRFDLERLYRVSENKIEVVYEGYEKNFEFRISNFESNQNFKNSKFETLEIQSKLKIKNSKFLLFIGRIEERKNVVNIVKAFEILKEKYQVLHKLVLAGKPGYGYEKIRSQVLGSRFQDDIMELGYVSDGEKFELMKSAEAFVFPTLYEGFGIPVLEAQSVGCPVIAGRNSSIPEVAEESAVLVDVHDAQSIAKAMALLIDDRSLREEYVQRGLENVKRFSWEKCAEEIAGILK